MCLVNSSLRVKSFLAGHSDPEEEIFVWKVYKVVPSVKMLLSPLQLESVVTTNCIVDSGRASGLAEDITDVREGIHVFLSRSEAKAYSCNGELVVRALVKIKDLVGIDIYSRFYVVFTKIKLSKEICDYYHTEERS